MFAFFLDQRYLENEYVEQRFGGNEIIRVALAGEQKLLKKFGADFFG